MTIYEPYVNFIIGNAVVGGQPPSFLSQADYIKGGGVDMMKKAFQLIVCAALLLLSFVINAR